MLRRILLGETPASISGRQYALRLAQGPKAGVAGLIGIDLPYLEAPMPGRVGASAYATHLHPTIEAFRSCLSMQAANWFRKELAVPRNIFDFMATRWTKPRLLLDCARQKF